MNLTKSLLTTTLISISLLTVFSHSAYALEPPRPGEIEALKITGEYENRNEFAKSLKNHKFDPVLIENMSNKIEYLKNNSPSDLDMTPPPAWQGMPSTGDVKILAVLIAFSDIGYSNSQADIHSKLFGSGDPGDYPYESLTNYYKRASYNKLNFDFGSTLGWYTTAYPRSDVPQTSTGRQDLIKEVLDYYDAQGHDFSQYDNDGDGDIDYFMVIWTGDDNGWSNFWWGYQTSFGDGTYTLDGKTLRKYSWQWESNPYPGTFTPRVVIHETGHALGLPDYYDYNGSVGPGGGVGDLDMMDANRADHNCFSKWMLDWITPTFVSCGSQSLTLRASGEYEDAVMVFPGADAGDLFSEYFMVQNRHKINNDDQYFPTNGDGMLIWHVDAQLNSSGTNFLFDNSYTDHKLLRLMEADGLEEIETGNGQADADDYYVAGKSFGPATTPNSNTYDGADSYISVTDFSAAGASMSATFTAGAASAEIKVSGNNTIINNGDASPNIDNHTHFGKANVTTGSVVGTFTIQNMGNSNLTIGSVILSGVDAADFSVTADPASTLACGETTTFEVTFDPSAPGERSAQITFDNNDSDENPFTFTIQGEGDPYCDPPSPNTCCLYITNVNFGGIDNSTGAIDSGYADYTDLGPGEVIRGQSSSLSVTIYCYTNVSYASMFIDWNQDYDFDDANETYILAENTIDEGPHVVSVDVPIDAATGVTRMRVIQRFNSSPDPCVDFSYGEVEDYSVHVTATDAPEMDVLGNGQGIVDGDPTPSTSDHTDFGAELVDGGTVVRTFTIENNGSLEDLTVGTISFSGTHAAEFSVSPLDPSSPVPAGNSATFNVTFDPEGPGTRTAEISIINNDSDETPYNFAIQGEGIYPPEMNVYYQSTPAGDIADGDTTPSVAEGTDFGSTSVSSGTVVRTYNIENTGAWDLTIGSISFTGAHASDFSVTSSPTSPVSPSGSTTFDVTFDPDVEGLRTAIVNIANNDVDETPYDFAIQGTGIIAPEINVQGNGVDISDEDITPSTTDHTDFGDVALSGGTLARIYTIQNLGDADLNVSNISIDGIHSFEFSLTPLTLPAVISPFASTSFEVIFDPGGEGIRTAEIKIYNDDSDEATYNYSIHGNGATFPDMNVYYESTPAGDIADGDTTPSGAEGTDFGNAGAEDTIVRTFTIENNGDGELTISAITITGDISDFSETASPASTVPAGGSTSFDIAFSPAGQNLREATISIANNDGDENPYNFDIQGTKVVKSPEMSVEGNSNLIPDGDNTPSTSDNTDFSDALADGGNVAKTFTIRNTGGASLNIGAISFSGTHAADFSVTASPASSVAKTSGATTFEVTFDPTGGGIRSAEISIINDDLDENPYNFTLQGNGIIHGDVNGDGILDLADAIIALKILSGVDVSGTSPTLNMDADCNGDGMIGMEDAIYILQKFTDLR